MVSEKRLIDANALKAKMRNTSRYFYIKYDIDEAPTVDAVEVVRCKNCKHCGVLEHNGKRYCKKPMGCLGCTPTEPENFCSYGERKDNG